MALLHPPLLRSLEEELMAKSQEFHAQTLVNTVWGFAKLAFASEPFLAAGCARALTLV